MDLSLDTTADEVLDTTEDPTSESSVDADLDGAGTCVPPGDVFMFWTVDGEELEHRNFEIPCTVMEVVEADVDHTIVELRCGYDGTFEGHWIESRSIPHPRLAHLEGESVILYYFSQGWEWQERWFTLRNRDGELLLAGLSASELCPAFFAIDEWYAPMSVLLATGLCRQEEGPCGSYERAALDIRYMGDRELVFDDTSIIMGSGASMHVIVDVVQHWDPVMCWDHPPTRIGAQFVRIPE